jgi:hypothetical protein
MAENKTVARAQRKAERFAEAARLDPGNVVTVKVEDSRLIPSSNLTRSFKVTVDQPGLGRSTTACWTADVEKPSFGNRSVTFFGWASSVWTLKSGKVSEGMCWIRVTSGAPTTRLTQKEN